ncbi:MAG: hypothetical protein O6952_07775 [Planctomycetota bacterium]|nr:hypothetical protein [Planctomycetota bacterium]
MMNNESIFLEARPPVSEAVVDMADDDTYSPEPIEERSADRSYLIPIAFCVVAIGAIVAAFLSGVDLTILSR